MTDGTHTSLQPLVWNRCEPQHQNSPADERQGGLRIYLNGNELCPCVSSVCSQTTTPNDSSLLFLVDSLPGQRSISCHDSLTWQRCDHETKKGDSVAGSDVIYTLSEELIPISEATNALPEQMRFDTSSQNEPSDTCSGSFETDLVRVRSGYLSFAPMKYSTSSCPLETTAGEANPCYKWYEQITSLSSSDTFMPKSTTLTGIERFKEIFTDDSCIDENYPSITVSVSNERIKLRGSDIEKTNKKKSGSENTLIEYSSCSNPSDETSLYIVNEKVETVIDLNCDSELSCDCAPPVAMPPSPAMTPPKSNESSGQCSKEKARVELRSIRAGPDEPRAIGSKNKVCEALGSCCKASRTAKSAVENRSVGIEPVVCTASGKQSCKKLRQCCCYKDAAASKSSNSKVARRPIAEGPVQSVASGKQTCKKLKRCCCYKDAAASNLKIDNRPIADGPVQSVASGKQTCKNEGQSLAKSKECGTETSILQNSRINASNTSCCCPRSSRTKTCGRNSKPNKYLRIALLSTCFPFTSCVSGKVESDAYAVPSTSREKLRADKIRTSCIKPSCPSNRSTCKRPCCSTSHLQAVKSQPCCAKRRCSPKDFLSNNQVFCYKPCCSVRFDDHPKNIPASSQPSSVHSQSLIYNNELLDNPIPIPLKTATARYSFGNLNQSSQDANSGFQLKIVPVQYDEQMGPNFQVCFQDNIQSMPYSPGPCPAELVQKCQRIRKVNEGESCPCLGEVADLKNSKAQDRRGSDPGQQPVDPSRARKANSKKTTTCPGATCSCHAEILKLLENVCSKETAFEPKPSKVKAKKITPNSKNCKTHSQETPLKDKKETFKLLINCKCPKETPCKPPKPSKIKTCNTKLTLKSEDSKTKSQPAMLKVTKKPLYKGSTEGVISFEQYELNKKKKKKTKSINTEVTVPLNVELNKQMKKKKNLADCECHVQDVPLKIDKKLAKIKQTKKNCECKVQNVPLKVDKKQLSSKKKKTTQNLDSSNHLALKHTKKKQNLAGYECYVQDVPLNGKKQSNHSECSLTQMNINQNLAYCKSKVHGFKFETRPRFPS